MAYNRIETPGALSGDEQQKLEQMYRYLVRLADDLNIQLESIGGNELTDSERQVMLQVLKGAAEQNVPEDALQQELYSMESLKSLIIKTASFVQTKLDEFRTTLIGDSVSMGQFGKYVRHTELDVAVNPEGITQSYSFEEVVQGLKNYTINAKNYIKTGLLRTVSSIPVYGVAIGKDVVTFDNAGNETYNDSNKVAELTADELSFYQGGNKVASYTGSKISFLQGGSEVMYIQNGKIYCVTDLEITAGNTLKIVSGGTLDVDTINFKISSSDEKMVCGDWTFDNNGCELIDEIPYQITNASNRQSGKGGIYWYTSNSQGMLRSFIELMPTMKESDDNYIYPKFRFYTYKNVNNNIWAKIDVLDVSEFMLFDDKPAYAIHTSRIQEIETIASAYDENILFTLWKHVTGGVFYNYIQFGLSANDEATITGGHLVITCKTLNYTNLVQSSSKDIKHNIQPLPSIGDRLDTMKPVTFIYDDDENEKQRMGLIYEDTVEVMPEICTGDESNKAINYVELIPALLKEIQDLRARVKQLEEREEQ